MAYVFDQYTYSRPLASLLLCWESPHPEENPPKSMFKGLFRTCSKTPSKMGKTSSKSSEKWEKLWGKCVSAFCSMHYCADSLTEVLVDLQGVLCLNTRFVFFTVWYWCWIHTTNWQCITIVVTERKWWFWRVMWFYCSYVPKQLDKPVCGLENGCGKALDIEKMAGNKI